MEFSYFQSVIDSDPEELPRHLSVLESKVSSRFEFAELNTSDRRQRVWQCLFRLLTPQHKSLHTTVLCIVKSLIRDSCGLEEIVTRERFDTLVCLAGLNRSNDDLSDLPPEDRQSAEMALKCLYNLSAQSEKVLGLYCDHEVALSSLIGMFSSAGFRQLDSAGQRFRVCLLSVLVTRSSQIRQKAYECTETVYALMELLEQSCVSIMSSENEKGNAQLAGDLLRALYAILNNSSGKSKDKCDMTVTRDRRMTSTLCDLVLSPSADTKLIIHSLQVLSCVPISCFSELIPADGAIDLTDTSSRIHQLLTLLLSLLTRCLLQENGSSTHETLITLLMFLSHICEHFRLVRKFFKCQVLPPRRDVTVRPGDGNDLKSALTRMMTSPHSELSFLSAHFLFVLCKENVERLVKYTGYGNAAGLLASRGLMLGGYRREDDSSDSDSDTEEYRLNVNSINPVTGIVEPERPDPMQDYSEERKIYETEKLLTAIQKTIDEGLVRPCRVGEDGRVQPITHVLEMQQHSSPSQQQQQQSSDSDS